MLRTFHVLLVPLAFALLTPARTTAEAPDARYAAMHDALERLSSQGEFSGAVVIRDSAGVRFARGYGLADPFTNRPFTPETPVDSASLAKPVTAALVLMLAGDGRIDLDAPVRRYLPGYPHEAATVRQLLSHSAGLPTEEEIFPPNNKTNQMIMDEITARKLPPLFSPGTGFNYCNLCYTTLALLIERVSGMPYLPLAQERVALPFGVTIRPVNLADWHGRAIGYRRTPDGKAERADSYEAEAFYGTANLSISASQLALWGAQWWKPPLATLRSRAVAPATINGKTSGLSLGNWYCNSPGKACHYLGHHEGFHHMLYRDDRHTVAMVSNNTLAPGLQQRLQRALVAFANGHDSIGAKELRNRMPDTPVRNGRYLLTSEQSVIVSSEEKAVFVERGGVRYRAYRIGKGIRYVPGLDVYLAGTADGRLLWLSLYEDLSGVSK